MSTSDQQQTLERLGEQFRRLRLARNIPQESLASSSGLGLSTVKRLENGRGCNLSAMVQLLGALGYGERLHEFLAQLADEAAGESDEIVSERRRASAPRRVSEESEAG
ncbi:helix-turn-helix domain-containing protein [Microbulbifer yueqingensis]|uniref:Transcriptional regulator, contains XRE-family HTH domain n=1 Tax=Microbulbifer yueqingensis TaxID=658219 RepID=A0A1G8Z9P2_9GAMM|nr:helix-turn-helix domain-containing protein [Microbulbifer yueqingensis]SDK11125.1 Transcriptional regulator, contains XRE-family HTH domain [Microbulbifer yueqingensis]